MDSTSSTENDSKECKYDPTVLQYTLHERLSGIIDGIEPQKKHAFLDILHNSLNSILSCFKCKSTLKENSVSFNCGHTYCKHCTENLDKCTRCNEGTIRTNIRNFSSILNIVTEIKSNFNSDKVIYEMIKYLLMPEKFSQVEEVAEPVDPYIIECTPCDSSLADSVNLKKSRKTAHKNKKSTATSSASKNSRKKLEFNKELNRSKNSTNTTNSDSSFFDTNKNKKKADEKKQSYLELQPPIVEIQKASTPVSSTRKRKNIESYLDQQPAISEMNNDTTPVSNKRKRKASDGESSDQIVGRSKRTKSESNSKDTLIKDEKSEPRSLRKRASGKNLESPQRSSDSPKGEKKQQKVLRVKLNPIFNEIIPAKDEVKTPFVATKHVDSEVLDLDIWERNDRYEKKKNLFKSVKERNKRNISIGVSLGNLLEHRKTTPKKSSPVKPVQNDDTEKASEADFSNGEKMVVEEFNSTDSAKMKPSEIEEILKEPVSKATSPKNRRNLPCFQIVLDRVTLKKQSPAKPDNIAESDKVTEISEVLFSDDDENQPDSKPIDTAKGEKIIDIEVLAEPTSKLVHIDAEVGKNPTETSREIEIPVIDDSVSTKPAGKKSIEIIDIEAEPIFDQETTTKSREILAEITDQQQNVIPFGNPTEKHKTPLSSAKSDIFSNKRGKLGSPLFPDTNIDVFSQKGNLCSSTPYVGTLKKVTKTYSKAKNILFSPISEEKNFENVLTFENLSPIVEKVRNEDDIIIISDEIAQTPKNSDPPKYPTADDSQEIVTGNTHVVVAEIHDVPVTPKTPASEKIPKLIQSQKPIESAIPPVDSRLDQITPMEVDNVYETVDKVTDEILSKTSESITDLEDEIESVDSAVERETKKSKVKKLQESINNKTEKTLSSLKKNFNKNSSKLSVEKIKPSASSTTPAKNSSHFSPIKSPPSEDQKEMNVISVASSTDYQNAPTQKRFSSMKSVACQTSPDLHLALLKLEYPHLFEKYVCDSTKKSYPVSVYDTPTEPINEGVKITAKTPDIRLLNTTGKFTRVSSITSSEKKRVDEQFMNESVLGNASFNMISAERTTNISDYTPLSPQTQGEKRKLSCRLNFDNDDDIEKEIIAEDVPPTICTESDEDLAIKNAPDFSANRSNEIDFSDDVGHRKDEEVMLSASILQNSVHDSSPINQPKMSDDSNRTFFELDKPVASVFSNAKETTERITEDEDDTLIAIPDTHDMGQKDDNDDKDQVVTDEDDDIDFVAGTPTSQPRRLLDNLEKIRTPHNLARKPLDVSLHEFSIVGNTTPNMSSIRPLDVSQYSAVKKPTAIEVTPVDEPAKKKEPEPVSLELFNSSHSVFSPAREKIFIATSGLKEPDVKIIKEFCEMFSAAYVDKLTDESTHLVVKVNHKNRSARTFKYLQAIVSQVRIVSMKWIHECLTKEKLINEENYIPMDSSGECGPLRTFHVIRGITPSPLSWLVDYCIYFTEPVPQECTLDQLQSIMRKTGAIVVNSLREFKTYPNHHHVIIISDDEDCDDEYNMKIAGWLQSYEAVSLEFNWILEVIGRNRLMPFADFEVIEIPNEYLLQRNFPSVMLQSNEEDQNSSD